MLCLFLKICKKGIIVRGKYRPEGVSKGVNTQMNKCFPCLELTKIYCACYLTAIMSIRKC